MRARERTRVFAKALVVFASVAWPGLPQRSEAAQVSFPVTATQTIVAETDEARVLLRTEDIVGLQEELILLAFLELDLPGRVPLSDLDVSVSPIVTRWRDQVPTWTTPWRTPGGDRDESYALTTTLDAGEASSKLRVDVTEAVQGMISEKLGQDGFLLSVPEWKGLGFTARDRIVLGALNQGRLVVTYKKISALGIRGGPAVALQRARERSE